MTLETGLKLLLSPERVKRVKFLLRGTNCSKMTVEQG